MKKSEMFWQTYLNLEKDLLDLSKYIYVTDEKLVYTRNGVVSESCTNQLDTFSPYIADLIVRTCIEIEAISKELYFEFGGSKKRGDRDLFFDEDCLKLIDIKCKTSQKVVFVSCSSFNLKNDINKILRPLKNAHKRQGTNWEKAYQAVKHDRYSSVCNGTIKNLIHALGALYLLNIYYKDMKMFSKYLDVHKLDMSLGSKIFSIKNPTDQYVIDAINGKQINEVLTSGDSPYILKYVDSTYRQVIEANESSINDRRKYFESQPEFNEPDFIKQLNEAREKEINDSRQRVMISWELCKYRINKRIPLNLPFEERKRLFISSPEFSGRIRRLNPHKMELELTEENLQAEIDSAGIMAGMELDQQFDILKMSKAFNEGYCELVIDKGNIKYNL